MLDDCIIKWILEICALNTSHELEEEMERLSELCNTSSYDEYIYYMRRPRRTLSEFLREFPGAASNAIGFVHQKYNDGDIDFVCWPKIIPRPYSVASNFEQHKVMIATGTGISLFRNLMYCNRERILFFGCRYRNADFYFRDEIEHLAITDDRFKYFVCFSREGQGFGEPKYVQDLLELEAITVCSAIVDREGIVIVCGSGCSKSPQGVEHALSKSLVNGGRYFTETEASNFILRMKKSKMLIFETWD
ncbi:hypothetical protein ACOME3_006662 [Neoechinorhynchus agilis]